ncbi:DUF2911 domain-containing protein [Zobellia galactanivorans]|uniref:Conserved hypothetical periplasmic protein n=1 Tax=Zobellia galactanivorans (strain DSM 12802 / CCUG 47099 / CIP 106680 / NCIMB 13871 / Dsij) TaxID=63186 RepID=G0LCF5_ZOBGA|nr:MULTISPECIES: DUF2911 domain-containing protein [Zobellia]MBU3027871.1 DUF2911 domain-containing protein [Zobellia galactanivorans]MDO6810811.1 DUF2911 domain-containing protein [Zobellia galactanivorans]OWW25099.1 asparagine synthetase B [Zobellia sp. OII3]CAZ96892.1 Conserved hypothetical periplasmic protein [Zobellia galactanivorans]
MKKALFVAFMALTMTVSTDAIAQKFSGLDKSPMDMASYPTDYKVSEKTVRIIYSRPQLKGRSLSELAPAGKVWRTGANEAAEITFYTDVVFGGKQIKAGSYSIFTIPGESEWTVILNKNLNQWGSYSYDESADVARVKAPSSKDSNSLEEFSIAFKEAGAGFEMVMGWDKIRVAVPIAAAKM